MANGNRRHCFTLNNYTQEQIEFLEYWDTATYICFSQEIAPTTGTPHLQGYFETENQYTISALVKKHLKICKGIHLEPAKANAEKNKAYCSKTINIDLNEGKWFERGEPKEQGKRNDLKYIKDEIIKGKSVDEITMENPIIYHQYGRTLERIETITLRKQWRKWMTEGEWYWGPTGVGKSHKAYENFDPSTHYVLNLNDNGWWDGYKGQPIVILNEFRGQIAYGELLDLIDCHPKEVKWRCREKVPFLAKKIIITSSMSPEDVYHNLSAKDSLTQLLRRLKIYYKTDRKSEWISQNNWNENGNENGNDDL